MLAFRSDIANLVDGAPPCLFCRSFLHLRMFSLAYDFIRFNTEYEVVGSYLSPVNDTYKKMGLAQSHHR